jgi:hypothetical protein
MQAPWHQKSTSQHTRGSKRRAKACPRTCSQRLACGTSGGTSESSFGAPKACTDETGVSSNMTGPRRQAPSECFER